MKVELHLHTSRYSACAANSPKELMVRLINAGYEAVYVTEHDAVWQEDELDRLRSRFPRIRIFPGVELTVGPRASAHLLVLGTNDPAYVGMACDEAGILSRARAEGHLTILAHPFRWSGGADMLEIDTPPDAIELWTSNTDLSQARQASRVARRMNLPVVNSGDVHSVGSVGRYWIETHHPVEQADDVREIILSRKYVNRLDGA